MDAVLTQLLSFPPHPPPSPSLTDADYDKQVKSFTQSIQKIPVAKLTGSVSGGSLLDILNPAINSISYAHILLTHILDPNVKAKTNSGVSEAFVPGKPLWQKLLNFMEQFDPVQMRYAGHDLRRLAEVTTTTAYSVGEPAAAIAPARSAILRMDPSGATFTSTHRYFVYHCLIAHAFAAALEVLDRDIYHFPTMTNKSAENTSDTLAPYLCSSHDSSSTYINTATGITRKLEYQEHLEYFLFGAMCYMALKDWDRAILFLEICLTSPTNNTASKIQAEAYKKWVLVSLLRQGEMGSLPKTANSMAVRMYQQLAKPYTGLADLFKQGIDREDSVTKVVAEAHEGDRLWQEDYNAGLVRQVVDAYRQFSVRRLGSTYAALPIPEVTRRTSHDPNNFMEMGQYVVRLISSGQLNASISKPSENPSTWILRFFSSPSQGPEARSEEQQHEELQRQVARVQTIISHVKEADRKFGLSKEYIQEQKRLQRGKETGFAGSIESHAWEPPLEPLDNGDEDMMADLR